VPSQNRWADTPHKFSQRGRHTVPGQADRQIYSTNTDRQADLQYKVSQASKYPVKAFPTHREKNSTKSNIQYQPVQADIQY
jgi:hypothetical protein